MRVSLRSFHAALAAAALLSFALPAAARQTLGCTTGGPGGAFPTSGTGNGTYQTTLPSFPLSLPLVVGTIPVGSTCVTEVKLKGISHTWVADLHFVLEAPSTAKYNIYCRPPFSCDMTGGDYTIVGPCGGGIAQPAACSGTATYPVGTYDQYFGTWTGGLGIANTSLYAVAPAVGTWTLRIYDWAGGDIGTITSWEICFGTPPGALPGVPTQTAPANGSSTSNPVVNLTWSAAACATSYDVDVDAVTTTGILVTNYSASYAVGLHSWKVRGVNGANVSAWSATRTFTVDPPPPPVPPMTCVSGGVGGAIPTSGTGDGAWPGTMPTFPMVGSLAVVVPAGSTKVVGVKLNGLSHTWVGDLHVVLEEPATLTQHTVFYRPGSAAGSVGSDCNPSGNYVILDGAHVGDLPNACNGASYDPGQYRQSFGDWPSGTNGIANTALGSIPISSGTWNLYIYDWAALDIGTLTDWELCFDLNPVTVTDCQTSPTIAQVCSSTVSSSGSPSVSSASPFDVTFGGLNAVVPGAVVYGITGLQAPTPWGPVQASPPSPQSYMCVAGPSRQRLSGNIGLSPSTGGTIGLCNGSYTVNFNAIIQGVYPGLLGVPIPMGTTMAAQAWERDSPSVKTTQLSDAVSFTVGS